MKGIDNLTFVVLLLHTVDKLFCMKRSLSYALRYVVVVFERGRSYNCF